MNSLFSRSSDGNPRPEVEAQPEVEVEAVEPNPHVEVEGSPVDPVERLARRVARYYEAPAWARPHLADLVIEAAPAALVEACRLTVIAEPATLFTWPDPPPVQRTPEPDALRIPARRLSLRSLESP